MNILFRPAKLWEISSFEGFESRARKWGAHLRCCCRLELLEHLSFLVAQYMRLTDAVFQLAMFWLNAAAR